MTTQYQSRSSRSIKPFDLPRFSIAIRYENPNSQGCLFSPFCLSDFPIVIIAPQQQQLASAPSVLQWIHVKDNKNFPQTSPKTDEADFLTFKNQVQAALAGASSLTDYQDKLPQIQKQFNNSQDEEGSSTSQHQSNGDPEYDAELMVDLYSLQLPKINNEAA